MNKDKQTCNFCGHQLVIGAPYCAYCSEKVKKNKEEIFK